MTTTKDIWLTLSKEQKTAKIKECLDQITLINNNLHPLSNQPDRGRLVNVKKDLAAFVLSTAEWEGRLKTSKANQQNNLE